MDNFRYFIPAASNLNILVHSNKAYSRPYAATYNIQFLLSTVWSIDKMSNNFEVSYPISK
jgi:hypothetical protein